MPYIGNTSADRFTASKTATQFSGNGSAVDFTLDHSVGSPEDILVSVDGVVQEPTVAYGIVSGTTLRFTAAPSSNSGNNIFVYYLFSTLGTVTHPATSALSATSGTFSGNTTVAGTSTFTGDVTIGDGSAADKKILFDGNAQDFHIGLDDSTDSLTIGLGSALGTTPHMIFDANGHITKPLQSAFSVLPSTTQSNLAIGSEVTIVFGTERIDQNADFASNTFTAPVTGRYQFNATVRYDDPDNAAAYHQLVLKTSNKTYPATFDLGILASDPDYWMFHINVLADMDASDTAYLYFYQNGGSATTDIVPDACFSGYLVA